MWKRRLEDVRIPGFHIQRSALSMAPFFSVLAWVGILSLVTEQAQYNNKNLEDFPGGPMAKTLHSQGRGPRFHPW